MIIYPISSLLELAENISEVPISLPFLESFAGKYSQKVTEDKKVPLFSKTSKYNNFPVRCQWKGGDTENHNQKYDRKREKNYKEKYQKNDWRNEKAISTEVLIPTKFNKVSGIKGLAMKILNKITEKNFNEQTKELLNTLLQNKEDKSVRVIAELILEKIWYDKGFYSLYVNLCKVLWDNDEWVSNCYKINCIKKGKINEYFYSLNFETKNNKPVLKGPFRTEEIAIKKAKKMSNFKSVFLSLCRDNFYKRDSYIKEASILPDSTKKYKLKRRLFGTVEILGYLYKENYLDENIIHYIFLSLLHTDNIHRSGAKYPEEIEAIKLLWDIVNEKIENVLNEYNEILQDEIKKNWGSRINFMIEDMVNILNKDNNLNETPIVEPFISDWNKKSLCDTFKISNNKNNEKIIEEMIKLSRHYTEKNNEDLIDIFKSCDNLLEFNVSTVSRIIKDCGEYGEYSECHANTIIFMLKNYNITKFSFDNLSEAFIIACEDISDLKIDAPKAPNNISFIIGRILIEIKEGKIKIDINKINDEEVDVQEVENEWKNILKLTEEFVSKDILLSRIEIFSNDLSNDC